MKHFYINVLVLSRLCVWLRCQRAWLRPGNVPSRAPRWLPDEDALVVVALPQATVALVGDSEDVGGQLPQVALAVLLHGGALVQACDGLVGVHGGDDGADVGLQVHGVGRQGRQSHTAPGWGCWARAARLHPAGIHTAGAGLDAPQGLVHALPEATWWNFNRIHLQVH